MGLKAKINSIIMLAKNNKEIIENYFFMTILQVLNSFFYLLIYPFLIRTLGLESYGLFVFATSITTYFVFLVNFGFDLPATKAIALNVDDKKSLQKTLSCVLTAKFYLFILASVVLMFLCFLIPLFRNNYQLLLICFTQIISFIIFPQWYFQAIQKMKIVTYIQLGLKLLSLPAIFLIIKNADDLNIYALIVSLSSILGGVIAYLIITFKQHLKVTFVNYRELKVWFKDALPFFLSTSASVFKEQSIVIIIGSFFGMKDVAIYDLASKIIIVPRTIFMSINGAIFPKLINNIDKDKIKKLINLETLISLSVIVFIGLFGKWIVQFMGGIDMLLAYPLSILLSVTVMTWLVVGAYISFVFIPNNKYFLVTKNQLIALVSFALYTTIGLLLYQNILVFGATMALSGITEIIYCIYVTKRNKLL
ncbi:MULTISPECIES: oligosaccharide flippase family protein [unclassified Empedobacter]|uniref:oligosaccharide flippase family protein n=1 Tax=unclassified Empedobacter TaxID=2643773 RepID=UPI00244BF543|nr:MULTISPECIES: oligosaccharide flippase family protein [unclassified Empedobacter]MDH2207313.1 oligosaccharide flippase family protein [Empedobacter sp. GD03644]